MDQATLVADRWEAGARFLRALSSRLRVARAFWIREEDSRRWELYVASPDLAPSGSVPGYRAVMQTLSEIESDIDPFQVTLVRVDAPIVRALEGVLQGEPASRHRLHRDRLLGEVAVAEMYVYPLDVAETMNAT